MTDLDIKALRRQQSDHRAQREALRADLRQKLERLRHGYPAHGPEHQAPAPVVVDAGGGYQPHPAHSMRPPAPLEPGSSDPMPREILVGPDVIELLTGRKRGWP